MTEWTDDPFRTVRIEFLLPHEIRTAVSSMPVAYVPLGTYEWHCEHLPILPARASKIRLKTPNSLHRMKRL